VRHRRVWTLVLSGVIAAFALGLATVAVLTRTEAGREYVLGFTLRSLGGGLNGELRVERLEGNLITGARLYELELLGHDGRRVVRADSAYLNYELPTLAGGDVVLDRAVLYGAELFLQRMPGDTLWNYQYVLLDTTRTPGPDRATVIRNAQLVGAQITVELPWEPDPRGSPAERVRELREALADDSRLVVREVPGIADGYLRTMEFDVDRAGVTDLVIASDQRGGTFVRVQGVAARVHLYRGDPLDVRDATGDLSLREGVIRYQAPEVVLPGSRLTSAGTIDITEPEPRYDLVVRGDQVDLDDLTWLYPDVPEDASASFELTLHTRDDGTLYLVRDLAFNAPGTRLVGSFGVILNDVLQFTDVNLTASPLRVEVIEAMLPEDLPVRGLSIGEVEIRSRGS
jgi:hypothetical protein